MRNGWVGGGRRRAAGAWLSERVAARLFCVTAVEEGLVEDARDGEGVEIEPAVLQREDDGGGALGDAQLLDDA